MSDKTEKKSGIKRVMLSILAALLAILLLMSAAVMIYVNHMLNMINRVDPELEHTMSSSEADDFILDDPDLVPVDPSDSETYPNADDIVFTTAPKPTYTEPTIPVETPTETTEPLPSSESPEDVYGDHLVNIMLVGQDRREGQGRQRSDTMLLVTFNKSDNTITLTSFMRDMYVQIPGYKPNRLNAAYAFGGMKLLSETLELNFGVKVDGMVEVDFNGFKDIIDLLGGVTVSLTQSEAKYLNDLHEVGILSGPVVVGENHLDSDQAMVYVQLREIDSDYHRTKRQRKLITAVIEAYKDQPLDKMLGMMDDILPLVTTDMTNGEILEYALDLFPMLATVEIQTLRLPLEGTYDSGLVLIREGFYAWLQYNIDFEANKEALYEIFRCKE